jgi:hypothetical protein
MTTRNAIWRSTLVAGLMTLAGVAAQPAFAAQSDIEYLATYEGDYVGVGQVSGEDNETIHCRMSMTPGNEDKINYQGRCLLAGATLSIAGTIAYNTSAHQYEAVMTSNTAFTGRAIGHRSGNDISFKLDQRAVEKGSDLSIAVGIALHSGAIDVNFQVVDASTGKLTKALVPFKRV